MKQDIRVTYVTKGGESAKVTFIKSRVKTGLFDYFITEHMKKRKINPEKRHSVNNTIIGFNVYENGVFTRFVPMQPIL